jgi:hypothetical protein
LAVFLVFSFFGWLGPWCGMWKNMYNSFQYKEEIWNSMYLNAKCFSLWSKWSRFKPWPSHFFLPHFLN